MTEQNSQSIRSELDHLLDSNFLRRSPSQPLVSARRVNARAVLSSRIVRVDEVLRVHTMLLSAPNGHMMGSKRFERLTTESDADFVGRLNPQIREHCLQSPSDCCPVKT